MKLSPNRRFLVTCEQHYEDPTQSFLSVYDMSHDPPRNIKPHMNITQHAENKDQTSNKKGNAARLNAKKLLDPAANQTIFGDKKTAKEKEA